MWTNPVGACTVGGHQNHVHPQRRVRSVTGGRRSNHISPVLIGGDMKGCHKAGRRGPGTDSCRPPKCRQHIIQGLGVVVSAVVCSLLRRKGAGADVWLANQVIRVHIWRDAPEVWKTWLRGSALMRRGRRRRVVSDDGGVCPRLLTGLWAPRSCLLPLG